MTAWWNSTTRVRKVRVRSIEAFRTLAFGAALVSADATEVEIVVMCAPGRWSVSDVAAGNPIQQAIIARQDAPILILAGVRRKSRLIVEIGQREASKNPTASSVTGTSSIARS